MTMKTATTLLLAARILLSLGTGTATAQTLAHSQTEAGYFSAVPNLVSGTVG
jgi:hypothetical protein